MSITNEDRYHLQAKANTVLGEKEGATLMELLPPVGWADVATKNDLNAQTAVLDAKFVALRSDLTTEIEKKHGALLRTMFSLATLMTAILSIVIAIAT